MNTLTFLPGDIIRAFRGIYFHYGVYVGADKVVHFCSVGNNELESATADIVETSLLRFSKGDPLSIDTSETPIFERDEIVRRARSVIGTKQGSYNLLSNNCEHFANWCRCGKLVSHQKILVESLVDTVVSTAPFLGALKEVVTAVFQEGGCLKIDIPSFLISKINKKSPNFHKLGLCYFRKILYLSEK